MVKLLLSIKATMENVSNLQPASDDFEYFFTVRCSSCNEVHPKEVSMNRLEERELSSSRGSANFVWKCGLCKRESSAKFEPTPVTPYNEESGQFSPFLSIECRGLEFINFNPRGTWQCVGMKGAKFTDVEFDEDDWTDYDEQAALPVQVGEFESKWSRL